MGGEGDHQQQHEGSEEPTGVGNASAPTVIHIRCTNGSKFSVETFLEAKIGDFKVLLAEKCDIPADQQRLIYKGRILKDDSSLQSYGLQSDHTVHLVRGASTSGSANSTSAENTVASNSIPAPPVQGVPSNNNGGFGGSGIGSLLFPGLGGNGLGGDGLGENNPAGLFGAGLPKFQQVQQQLTQNPNMIQEMMNMPAIQNLMNNPDLMRNLIMSNPQMREIIDRNPDLAHILNDPGTLRQTLDAARNPELMREMMRNTDRAMSNIESSPEGFNMLRRMYETVQEPFLNATTMGGDSGNELGSNPFSSLFGQGSGQTRAQTANPSTTASDATGSLQIQIPFPIHGILHEQELPVLRQLLEQELPQWLVQGRQALGEYQVLPCQTLGGWVVVLDCLILLLCNRCYEILLLCKCCKDYFQILNI